MLKSPVPLPPVRGQTPVSRWECGSAFAFTMGQHARRSVSLVAWAGDPVSEYRLLLQRGQVSDGLLRELRHGFLDARVDLMLHGFHGDADRVADGEAGR